MIVVEVEVLEVLTEVLTEEVVEVLKVEVEVRRLKHQALAPQVS